MKTRKFYKDVEKGKNAEKKYIYIYWNKSMRKNIKIKEIERKLCKSR